MVANECPQHLRVALGTDILSFSRSSSAIMHVNLPNEHAALPPHLQYKQLMQVIWQVYWQLRKYNYGSMATLLLRRVVASRTPIRSDQHRSKPPTPFSDHVNAR